MKAIIFDSGPIISFTMNGLLPILEKLKQKFDGEFIITPQVENELVAKPLKIDKYRFEALEVKYLIEKGVLTLSSKFISDSKVSQKTNQIMDKINSSFIAQEPIQLIHIGESSCFAFASLCNCDNVIAIDERTARLLVENPENLRELMQRKLHTKIQMKKQNLKILKNFKIIRSPELVYLAYKKSLFKFKENKQLLDALLYAVKYKGASISRREIEEIESLV